MWHQRFGLRSVVKYTVVFIPEENLSRVTPTLRSRRTTSRYEFCVKNSWFAQNPNNLTDKTPRSAPTRLSRRRQKQKRLTEKGPQQLLALETQFLIETLVCGKAAGTQQGYCSYRSRSIASFAHTTLVARPRTCSYAT